MDDLPIFLIQGKNSERRRNIASIVPITYCFIWKKGSALFSVFENACPILVNSALSGYNKPDLWFCGLWLKIDASRRQNDPRKPGKLPVSMVRLRSQSVRANSPREAVVGGEYPRSEPSRRRVWGQRPGQRGAADPQKFHIFESIAGEKR